MKALKKLMINVEAVFDNAFSRFEPRALPGLIVIPALFGMMGAIFSLLAETDHRENFVDENAVYEPMHFITAFPDSCDVDDNYYFVQRGPNNRLTLYNGANGYYRAQDEGVIQDFVDDARECLDAVENLSDLRQQIGVGIDYQVTQPFRSVNKNDSSEIENFRMLRSGHRDWYDFGEWARKHNGPYKAIAALRAHWDKALDALEDGKTYDHISDKNVKTFTYEDSYLEYNWNFMYGAVILGGILGCGVLFSATPGSAAQARKESRDARRLALTKSDVNF